MYRRHTRAASVRAWGCAVVWTAATAALLLDILPWGSFVGISGSLLFLIALNPSTLWVLNFLDSKQAVRNWSLTINLLEIIGYTAVIHFSGGIEAAHLTLIYAALIVYVGILGRSHLPFALAALSSLCFSAMVVAEQIGWIRHISLGSGSPMPWKTQIEVTLVSVGLLFVVALISAQASARLWDSREKIRHSESQFRTLVENVPGLVYLSKPGSSSGMIYLGGLVEELTGWTAEEVLSGHRTLLDLCHPDERSRVGSTIDLAILDRTEYVVDYRMQHANGPWRWVEERGRPIFDRDGQLLFLEGIVLEISDRKTLERETSLRTVIQQVAREWQLTFDTVESPILILDDRGRIQRLNRAARNLAGLDYDVCKGRHLTEIRREDPWLSAEQLIKDLVESRSSGPRHRLLSSESGHWELTATFSPQFVEERIVMIMQDATRIVELEDSLRRGEKLAAMGSLVGGVAHEVRNPLFGVSATLDAMRVSFSESEELQPYLAGLRSQVDRMTDLMNSLLEYGRSSTVEHAVGHLEGVLAKALVDCEPLVEQTRVEVIQDVAVDGRILPMNEGGLVTLFGNLIANAVQHSPAGSQVRIVATVGDLGDEHWVECTIRDSGPGFEQEALSRACEPFFSRRAGGMGLGLAIVERIVEDHGGRLSLENHSGGGAVVSVRLPAEAAEVRATEPSLASS